MHAADTVVAAIDANALAVYLAQKTPEEGPGAEKRKKEFDEQVRAHELGTLILESEEADAAQPACCVPHLVHATGVEPRRGLQLALSPAT